LFVRSFRPWGLFFRTCRTFPIRSIYTVLPLSLLHAEVDALIVDREDGVAVRRRSPERLQLSHDDAVPPARLLVEFHLLRRPQVLAGTGVDVLQLKGGVPRPVLLLLLALPLVGSADDLPVVARVSPSVAGPVRADLLLVAERRRHQVRVQVPLSRLVRQPDDRIAPDRFGQLTAGAAAVLVIHVVLVVGRTDMPQRVGIGVALFEGDNLYCTHAYVHNAHMREK
jgi:hypothetical protein